MTDVTPTAGQPELSVVLPAFNESNGLRAAVSCYLAELSAAGIDGELIIIDDASTDGTGAVADELAANDARVRVVRHERNLGQVAGIRNGFRHARGAIVTHNGVDLPFHPRDTRRMIEAIRAGSDVVVVQRASRAAYGIRRKVISWANIGMLKLLFGSPFVDHNFVQFYRSEVTRRLPIRSNGVSTVTPELIFRAIRAGYRVTAETAEYHERRTGTSSIRLGKVLHAFGQTIRLWGLLRGETRASKMRREPKMGAIS